MVCETIRGTEQNCLPPRIIFIYRIFNRGDMARMARIPPTTRRLSFILPEGNNGIVDLGQSLSMLNRKAFRQGMEYYVDSWTLESTAASEVTLQYLSQTWVNCNAWVKAFRTWMKSQEQVDDFDEIKGRYHDFKIHFDANHSEEGMLANLIPIGFNRAAVGAVDASATASWTESHIQIPNDGAVGVTNEYKLHLLGADAAIPGVDTKGIVAGYAASRSRPMQDDPNIVLIPNWMDAAFDDGDNLVEIRGDVITENDSPPYFVTEDVNFEFYPGGSNQITGGGLGFDLAPTLAINPAVGSWATKFAPGFIAPCGLLRFLNSGGSTCIITLNIALGPYKGVMARPMQDVN